MGNLTPFLADHVPRLDPPEAQLAQAMRNAGQSPPDTIILDGVLHRYDDQKANGDALWYVGFSDGVPGGSFGSFRLGTHTNWKGDIGRTLSLAEEMAYKSALASAKQKFETEKRIKNELAADDCAEIWDSLTLASEHPYLIKKGILPHGARVDGSGRLVIPMLIDGKISSLQTISQSGDKLFHKGGRTKGASFSFGTPGSRVYLAEGFATAATIYEETGTWSVASFSAQNLVDVAESLRQSSPELEMIIVADLDKNGTGLNYANQAAAKYGASVIVSPVDSDVNDYRQSGGDVRALLSPPRNDPWLVDGDTFTEAPAPIRWLVKKWLQADSLMMVHGPSGSGKTFLVLDWCLTLASGLETWRDFRVRPCPVVYLAGEGHNGIKGRIAAWKINRGYKGSLKTISISRSGCDLNTPLGLQKVLTEIRALPAVPGLVVVDTLHRFLVGDENSAQDAKTMLDTCALIQQEFSCSVLLVHHTGVNEEAQHRARGSSAWRGALDIEISVQPAPESGGVLTVLQKKSKDSELADKLHGELIPVAIPGWFDDDGEPVTSAVLIPGDEPKKRQSKAENEAQESIVKAWRESGEELADGFPYVTKSAWRASMVRDGMAEKSANQYVKASAGHGYARKLSEAGSIEDFQSGYKILFPVVSNKLFSLNK